MSGIHELIMNRIQDALEKELITDPQADLDLLNEDLEEGETPATDPTIAGVVVLGPLQGNPDPDQARISVTVHENDPDDEVNSGLQSASREQWVDKIEEVEIGGSITWRRRFTVKVRCLFEQTKETLEEARNIASIVRSRVEDVVLAETFSGISTTNEYVSMGAFRDSLESEMFQAGGPPDSYDFHIRVRFEVLTTKTIGGSL